MGASSNVKMRPMETSVTSFLAGISEQRREEAHYLIGVMSRLSGEDPVLWGSSIIGFGIYHYRYESGREGDMPILGFSPRKTAITIYFGEGFDPYKPLLDRLGNHRTGVGCLYINKLKDVKEDVLYDLIAQSYDHWISPPRNYDSLDSYLNRVPVSSQGAFTALRHLVGSLLEDHDEVLAQNRVAYQKNGEKPTVYISAWADHVSLYPVKEKDGQFKPYLNGGNALWFSVEAPIPKEVVEKAVARRIETNKR